MEFSDFILTLIMIEVPQYVALAVIVWYVDWHLPRQSYAMIYRKTQQGVLMVAAKIILSKLLRPFGDHFNNEGHSYIIDWDKTAYYSSYGKPVLVYIEGCAEPVSMWRSLGKIPDEFNSKKLNTVLGRHVIRDLVAAARENITMGLAFGIMIAVAFFAIGFIVGPYVMPHTVVVNNTQIGQ